MSSRIAHWAAIITLSIIGLYLGLLGAYLAFLGGSFYYLAIGLATLLIVFLLYQRRVLAVTIYAIVLAATVIWALFESGLHFLGLLPRLAFWLVIAAWFFGPWYRRTVEDEQSLKPARTWLALSVLAAMAVLVLAAAQGYEHSGAGSQRIISPHAPTKDWRHYGNDEGGTRFAQLDQINTDTVSQLTEVWRFRTGVPDDFKMTPLQVNGLLYLCGARNVLIAIDSDTGDEVWRHDPQAKAPAQHQYALTCRGLGYVELPESTQDNCAKRIVTATVDARMIAVDALTGQLCTDFGREGAIDLRQGMGRHLPDQYYVTSPPLVAGQLLVVGGLVLDSQDLGLPSGVVRAYDAVSGEFVWAWDLGKPGVHSQPVDGEEYTRGTPNVWSVMSYDAKLNLIYVPTGNASPDYYGGERRAFDDEWSSSIVAINADTGSPRWKFQTVHHDIWDYDLPAQPVLVDVERDGKLIPSVAVPTKRGDVFLLDRRSGDPVYPVEEKPVPQGAAPGEYLSPTQPFSPLPSFHPFIHEKDTWGLTPLDQLACRVEYKLMRYEGLFTPPTTQGSLQFPANFGGFNWGSVSVDADHGLLIAAPMLLANRLMLVTPEQVAEAGPRARLLLGKNHPAVRMDPNAPLPEARAADLADPFDHRRIRYYGLTLPFMSRLGTQVPCFEPPWSKIAVIDLNTKELLWSRPLGSMKESGPFGWRSGLPFQVGVAVRAGTLTTRGGLTFISSTMDRTVRAYDVRSGEVKWSAELPGNGQATPMTYLSDASGRQFLIVTVPNPSWRYPRDPKTGTYSDSQSVKDDKGGFVIAYAIKPH